MVLTEVPLVLKEGSISDIPLPDAIEIELKNGFHIPKSKLPSKVLYELKKLATFGNPEFYKAQAKRFSTHRIPKMIDCSELRDGSLVLPRCCVNCKAPSEFVNYCPQNPTN
ncbi:hypothetical protein J2S74_004183 [Evansella vedderi]|uniref:Reverse transcriptase domain-containing protein n=1 Tax=Evansella vedderi TaxID=38282 RepID=A0ABT9ZZU9_9BACI|nr:hypothetical protein [Evansella vedderi]MDQ0256761.1 hypothetical protein [Evansella vedderi]